MLASVIVVWNCLATASAAAAACPDVSGRYSVTGLGFALNDAMTSMHANSAAYLDSGVELSGAVDGTLSVWTKAGRTGSWSTRPLAVLRVGTDFECSGGNLVFIRSVKFAKRKTDEGTWYQGESTTSLSRGGSGELSIAVRFTGSERISLYSYDSANVTIPKPGSRTTLIDSYGWPAYADSPAPVVLVVPEAERIGRERLTSAVLGNVRLAGVKSSGDGIVATLSAPRSNDVAAFEDRLRSASIGYEMRVAPIWSNNAYHMELLIHPAGAAGAIGRPSAFRIEQELQRILPALVDVDKVTESAQGYVVTLNFFDSQPIADVIRRVHMNSSLIGMMELIDESASAGSRVRVVRLNVGLRQGGSE